jgi:hypothetical protein
VRALLGPRFGVEATFIVAVAIFAGLLELPLPAILTAVFGAWALVALAEVVASRRAATRGPAPPASDRLRPPAPPAPISAPRGPGPEKPEPLSEPVAAEVLVEFEPEPEPAAAGPEPPAPITVGAEPEVPTELERARLVAVPAPEPVPELEPPPEQAVVALHPAAPREWNLWDLERRWQARAGASAAGDELSYVLMYLREYASPDGVLPVEFDALVRESFGELVEAER